MSTPNHEVLLIRKLGVGLGLLTELESLHASLNANHTRRPPQAESCRRAASTNNHQRSQVRWLLVDRRGNPSTKVQSPRQQDLVRKQRGNSNVCLHFCISLFRSEKNIVLQLFQIFKQRRLLLAFFMSDHTENQLGFFTIHRNSSIRIEFSKLLQNQVERRHYVI